MKKFLIRTDASSTIGTGHIMRCLTLANEIEMRGGEVAWVSAEEPGNINSLIRSAGFHVHSQMPTGEWDWLIVDHYHLNHHWERTMRSHSKRILVIDDLANRSHDCDLLVDTTFPGISNRYLENNLVSDQAKLLLGPKYCFLRPEFLKNRKTDNDSFDASKSPIRILVNFGGGDPTNETQKVLQALDQYPLHSLSIRVMTGFQSSPPTNLPKRHPTQLLGPEARVAEEMKMADLFIGAGGTTTWERLCVGLPSLVVTIADNQVNMIRNLAQAGYLSYLGSSEDVSPKMILESLQSHLENPDHLAGYSKKGQALVDGLGVHRVADSLIPRKIELRPAKLEDARSLFEWRMDPINRDQSFQTEPFSYESHLEWLTKSLENQDRVLLIGYEREEAIGVLRYDLHQKEALVSIYLVPGHHGKGYGSPLLESGSEYLKTHFSTIEKIRAEIKPENLPSQKAFLNAKYRKVASHYERELR